MAGRFGRGPGNFARPENALKRAEELENVGQRGAALQVLHDIVTNRKNRTWSKTFESIMFKHIELVGAWPACMHAYMHRGAAKEVMQAGCYDTDAKNGTDQARDHVACILLHQAVPICVQVVEMKKRNYGKEALMQYRNMCQAVNINVSITSLS